MKEKLTKPSLRGERWLTWDSRTVTLIRLLKVGVWEVINERGLLEALWVENLREKL